MKTDFGYKILIVDDSELNRAILSDIIDKKFTILEAGNGIEAMKIIQQYGSDLSLVLLDLVMPDMDGLEVLAAMNRLNLINKIPVIMISSENSPSYVERAYELGATDFINRPFNVFVVRKRIANTIILYSKQRNLINLVSQQIYEKEKNIDLMINILSHIVEFRNGESGLHILHVNTITELLLKQLVKKTDKYNLSPADIESIVTASSLHDIGKISVPDEILNKPGRLTPEEFEIVKKHSEAGAKMLSSITDYIDEPLVVAAQDICMYHHERYDGKGYPCGLKGDEIPISAQVVAMADVYDALVSERCYKDAIEPHKALEMICNGECGCFNPLLIECLCEIGDFLENEIKINSLSGKNFHKVKKITNELLNKNENSPISHSINYLEQARSKYEFFAAISQEIQFEYTVEPEILTISDWCAEKFHLPLIILDPMQNKKLHDMVGEESLDLFRSKISQATPENSILEFTTQIKLEDTFRFHRVICRVNWSDEDTPVITGIIGKLVDIEKEYRIMAELKNEASLDPLTNIYNHRYCVKLVNEKLSLPEKANYALVLFDLDDFKIANDTYGHMFGDEVLMKVASTLTSASLKRDIVARIGGDEFMLFVEYADDDELHKAIAKFQKVLCDIKAKDYTVKVSTGVATTEQVGYDYDALFNCADTALYYSKGNQKNTYSFYDENMKISGFNITPIENGDAQ